MDGMDELFQPDTITPAQFFDRRRPTPLYEAERRLIFAAFQTALQDCRKPVNSGQNHLATRRRWQSEAREWLNSDGKGVLTFRWYCDALELDPEAVRKAVAQSAMLSLPRAEPRASRQVITRGRYRKSRKLEERV